MVEAGVEDEVVRGEVVGRVAVWDGYGVCGGSLEMPAIA